MYGDFISHGLGMPGSGPNATCLDLTAGCGPEDFKIRSARELMIPYSTVDMLDMYVCI